MTNAPVPILLVTGFLGAGKTTFINWLIHAVPEKKISLILNEFGDIKLESNFIKKEGIGIVTELANGCMCCVAKSDIPRVIKYILDNAPSTQLILIEASGLSDPDPVRDVLQSGDLTSLIRLDTVVCVVDALNFDAQKNVHPIILSQIGDANLILLSKISQLESEDIATLTSKIEDIGMGTKVVLWDDHLMPEYFVGLYFDQTEASSKSEHVHEQIDDYWYTSNKSLDISKLNTLFSKLPKNIIRAKGYMSGGGSKTLIQYVGNKVEFLASEGASDPKVAILFLGNQIDTQSLQADLDACQIN